MVVLSFPRTRESNHECLHFLGSPSPATRTHHSIPKESSATIAQWGTATFGDAASVKAYALRAQEELAELIEAIESGEPDTAIAHEAADVTILLHRITGTLNLELYEAVDEKMVINRQRKWTRDGKGVGQHI